MEDQVCFLRPGEDRKGESVFIRPPEPDEMQWIRKLWADTRTMKEVGGTILLDENESESWYRRMVFPGNGTNCYCLIFTNSGTPVGEVSFHRWNWKKRSADFNIKIEASLRGKGYGRDAILLLLRYFFCEAGGSLIVDDVAKGNIPGQKALLNFGFVHDPSCGEHFPLKMDRKRFLELYG